MAAFLVRGLILKNRPFHSAVVIRMSLKGREDDFLLYITIPF
jgi:hypothetical protein